MEDFKAFLKVADALFILIGILFLFAPNGMTRLQQWANLVLFTVDKKAYNRRKLTGAAFLILAGYLTYVLANLS